MSFVTKENKGQMIANRQTCAKCLRGFNFKSIEEYPSDVSAYATCVQILSV